MYSHCILMSAGTFEIEGAGGGGSVGSGGWWEGRGRGEKWNNKTTRRGRAQVLESAERSPIFFFANRPSAMESGLSFIPSWHSGLTSAI